MKKLLIIAVALFTISATAQERENRRGERNNFSAEQKATLLTKKMAVELDLSEAQQSKIQKLNLERAKGMEAKKESFQELKAEGKKREKPTSQEIFERKNARLEKQLATQKEMKQILNEEQYEKWLEKKSEKKKRQGKRENFKNKKQRGFSRR